MKARHVALLSLLIGVALVASRSGASAQNTPPAPAGGGGGAQKIATANPSKIFFGMKETGEIKKQLATAQEQAAVLLAKAGTDAQKVIEEAKLAAKNLQERESSRALAEAEQIVRKAREESELQYAKMLVDLKRVVSRLVIETTSKVAGRILTDDDQKRLSDEAAKELAA